MKRVLVGFDGSEGAENALNKAMNIIDENGEVILLAVVLRPTSDHLVDSANVRMVKNRANSLLNTAIRDVGDHEFSLIGIVRDGEDIASVIIDVANELNVDVIVLGSKGSSELGRYPIGSVANKVVLYAKKPVMVCR